MCSCFRKTQNLQRVVTDPNPLLWQGKTFALGFVLLPVPTAAFGLAVLLWASLLFHWMVQQGTHRHKRNERWCWVLVGPGALHNPSSHCSTFHSDYLFIDCMTKTCNQIKYRWEDSLDNEIPSQTWQLNCARSRPVIRKGRGQTSVPSPALTVLLRKTTLGMVLHCWVAQEQVFMKLVSKV